VLLTGSHKSLENVVGSLSPPLKLVCEDKQRTVITGDSIVQWRAANPSSPSSHPPVAPLVNGGVPQARSAGVVALPRRVKTISAHVQMKQQEDAIRREFGALMKPHRSKFTSEVCCMPCYLM